MSERLLAQINLATLRAPEGDPLVADFFANLDRINALAESSDGFVWRLTDDDGANATGIAVDENPVTILNMSVWRDVAALRNFVYRSAHSQIMARRGEWMVPHDGPFQVLWWIEDGAMPSAEDGLSRLDHLRANGPTSDAFTFATARQFDG